MITIGRRQILLSLHRTGFGNTSLHLAAHHGYEEIIEALIENGADVNVQNINGVTPDDGLLEIPPEGCENFASSWS